MAHTGIWLFKSEPVTYSLDHLKKDSVTFWDGVRNYRARNFLWKETKVGDLIVFYHSNAKPSAACGLAKVASEPKPDPTQLDPQSDYFDPKSSPENRRWYSVDVQYLCHFKRVVPLAEMKQDSLLKDMMLTQKGDRLSIQPLEKQHFLHICSLGEIDPAPFLS